ncbi:polysaccharide biosynthesis protein [Natronogracilivirga saccharolytica]|uniref:Polysaccharide biosynthesis protein n=1 Tax=Natronogracilivirga saccharolytica TaxID=2812953 RepID=A0A8J7S8N8_9BACT|nr:nucleoside-diphosphate sugar epimerase/dehydratase [Natronogracilivirga saccharolytica]MBP3192296.1 polysaccharide biosynthesis protein [Natronogracilivirga saccharolytica]
MSKQTKKFIIDLTVWSLALPVAYILRLEGDIGAHISSILLITALVVPIKAVILYGLGLHLQNWPKISVLDLFHIIESVGIVSFCVFLSTFFVQSWLFIPQSVPIIEAFIAIIMLSSVRLGARLLHENSMNIEVRQSRKPVKRVLIAGAGEAGTQLARTILRHPESHLKVVGFLDDLSSKQKEWFMGLPVFGGLADLKKVVREQSVDKLIIALPTVSGHVIRSVVEHAQEAEVEYKIIPSMFDLLGDKFEISQLRDVNLEDLLRRKPVTLDIEPISEYLNGRTVMVTGAGGSIGSEIIRQVTRFDPDHIVLLGRGENSIFEFERECRKEYPHLQFTSLIADVRDYNTLESHFKNFRPDVIFHAAAHKHVPLMEANPDQAIFNNVIGTRNLTELALEYGVKRFVNISSDKSVNPTSIMGCSKRVAEFVVEWASLRAKENQSFVSVRFGNVLGSRGSVVPLFKQQIQNGGPVTITHENMTRYFMTIPEASQLVLQAGGLGQNGSVYVLDMGQPVRIIDLACDLIRLSGLEPYEDIRIVSTGIRPGEKLYEELLTAEEGTTATHHSKIFTARCNGLPEEGFMELLDELLTKAMERDHQGIRIQLKKMIPTYALETTNVQTKSA